MSDDVWDIDAAELEHFAAGSTTDGSEFHAECCCGWTSDGHPTQAAAEAAISEHRDEVVGPPDEMDHLMSGLLDLQDDLADVVVWLAENWSADLPVPAFVGLEGGHAHLAAWCKDPAGVARAAERLGVPIIIDEEHGGRGGRCHRAIRSFGGVCVEVVTETPGEGS
jgi:hypothetical protein